VQRSHSAVKNNKSPLKWGTEVGGEALPPLVKKVFGSSPAPPKTKDYFQRKQN